MAENWEFPVLTRYLSRVEGGILAMIGMFMVGVEILWHHHRGR